MNETWDSLSPLQKEAIIQAYKESIKPDVPLWYENGKLNEVMYVEALLNEMPLFCVNNRLYTSEGMPVNEDRLASRIMNQLSAYMTTGLPKRVSSLMDSIRLRCFREAPLMPTDRINISNGTLFTDGTFSDEKMFCLGRLPVSYDPGVGSPGRWMDFLGELLEPEDIITLQEFMGYLLIPTNRGQKMLMIIGKGGEGKSRIGIVLKAILGDTLHIGSVQRLENDRFARANLIGKLAMFDDDMVMEALPETHLLKSIITLEGEMDVEVKGKQSFQAPLYSRIIAVGNGALSALHDRSDGFYRRQIILTARPVKPGRVNDPFLSEKLVAEKEAIFLWCFEGLKRLLDNDYRFTISEYAEKNMASIMEEGNNILSFIRSSGYIRFEAGTCVTTAKLYETYLRFCTENCLKPMSERTLSGYFKENADKLGIRPSNTVDSGVPGKKVRGFIGMFTMLRTNA